MKYKVTLSRRLSQIGEVVVDAPSFSEARRIARREIDCPHECVDWEKPVTTSATVTSAVCIGAEVSK